MEKDWGSPSNNNNGFHRRGNGEEGDEDTPDVLVPPLPLASSSIQGSQAGFSNGSGGTESSDARRWYNNAFWKGSKQAYQVQEIQAGAGPLATCGTTDTSYNMNHLRRGHCIIFNHSKFDKIQKLTDRTGTEVDVTRIQTTFANFGFNVVTFHNLVYNDIMQTLQKCSSEDHSPNDCLVVFVLTHGQSNLLHAFDVSYKPSSIWSFFTADRCTTLAGKPKMFFIQACRGELYDDGTELRMKISRTQVDGPSKDESYRIPNQADFLTVFSTFEAAEKNVDYMRLTMQYLSLGYFSWRNSRNGSCFIKSLCRIFEENSHTKDVLSMMTLVNRDVGISYESRSKESSQNMKKQIPHVCHTLMRDIFLKPKFQSTLV